MRRTTTLTVLLLGASLLAPTGVATAASETCRGEAATIVGTGPAVQGTDGRDVIVSGAASTVDAGAGDDLVCLVGSAVGFGLPVDAGSGNDVVDAAATSFSSTDVDLGAGADAFVGSAGSDDVQASGYVSGTGTRIPDDERDVIDTGAGHDRIASFRTSGPNLDVILAGPGSDHVYVEGPMSPDAQLDAGEDGDQLVVATIESVSLSVDAAAGVATLDGADWVRWSGFESLEVSLRGGADLAYAGSEQADRLGVISFGGDHDVVASMNGGDDRLELFSLRSFGHIDTEGGSGRDTVEVVGLVPVVADLRNDTLTWDALAHTIGSFENVSAVGSNVRLTGDHRRNALEGGPCVARIQGGGGADDISRRGEPAGERIGVDCDKLKAVFDGGPGQDRLDGSRGSDVLRGGPGNDRFIGRQGRDTGVGGPGRDRCSTEIRKSCEGR